MDDAAGIKLPTVVCHALDCRFVFAGEGHACQTATVPKRQVPDACHTIRYYDAREATAVRKRLIAYSRHTIRYRDAHEATAVRKRTIFNTSHTKRNCYAFKIFTP